MVGILQCFFYLFNYNNQYQFLLLKNHMFDEKSYLVIICTLVFLIKMGRARVGYKGRWRLTFS